MRSELRAMSDAWSARAVAHCSLFIAYCCRWHSAAGCGNVELMADERKSWLRRRVETAFAKGLTRAYSSVRVDPEKFLLQLRTAYRLPISGYHGVYSLDIGELDEVAQSVIRSGMKFAAVEGAGFGVGRLDHDCSRPRDTVGDHDAHDSETQSRLRLRVQYRR